MAQRNSNISKASGPQRAELSLPPSQLLLVCGPEDATHPTILQLAVDGFLTIRHDAKHFAFDERAGTVLPNEDELWGYEEHGQIQPGSVQIDGNEWPVTVGRTRLKGMAILNQRASEKEGKFTEPFSFRFITAKGTEETSFIRMILENAHRGDDPPSVLAAKMLRGKEVYRLSDEVLGKLFQLGPDQVKLTLGINELDERVRHEVVDTGEMSAATAVRQLGKMPRREQMPAVEKLREEGLTKGTAAVEALKKIRAGKAVVRDEIKGERAIGKARMLQWAEMLAEEAKNDPEVKAFRIALLMSCGLSPSGCARFRKLVGSE